VLIQTLLIGWSIGTDLNEKYHLSEKASDKGIEAKNVARDIGIADEDAEFLGGVVTFGISIGAINPALF
jgi:hypothetical protein